MNRSIVFLRAYRESGSITKAADAAGIHRSIHYRRLKEDPKYKAAFDEANEAAVGLLEDEAIARAKDGDPQPVFFKGEICGQTREKSDQLLMFLLRAAKPAKYRERYDHTISGNLNVTKFKGSLEELLATYRVLTTQENGSPEA